MITSYVFGFNGLIFFLLTLMLVSSWGVQAQTRAIVWPSLASAVWSLCYAFWYAPEMPVPHYFGWMDILKTAGWLFLLGRLLTTLGMSRRREYAIHGASLLGLLAVAVYSFSGSAVLGTFGPGMAAAAVHSGLSLLGIILALRLFRDTPLPGRWSLNYVLLAAVAVFAVDLYASIATLISGARQPGSVVIAGYSHLFVFVMFAVGALRSSSWPSGLQLSHSMVFMVTTSMAVGLYLFAVALGGYYIDLYGGGWGRVVQIAFLLGAVSVLVILLASDTVRARFRVFVAKHFQRYKYDYRTEWLRFTQRMSAAASEENVLETSILAMADIVGSPGGAMWVADDVGEPYRLRATSLSESRAPELYATDDPVPAFCRRYGWVIDLHEFRESPESYGPLELTDELACNAGAWLIVPLLLGDVLVGFVLLDVPPVAPALNFEDRDLLKTVGRAVATHVSQFEASRRLSEHQQFGAYHRLSTFLMHDLKNLISQLSLVVANAEKHKHNPEFIDDAIATISLSVERMNKMIRQFSGAARPVNTGKTSLRSVIETAVHRCAVRCPVPQLTPQPTDALVEADPDRLVAVFEHILSNAQDATPDDGRILVSIECREQRVAVGISDTGVGMSEPFIHQRLFRPFDSTKGDAGLGIGAYQAREYVRAVGGDIHVSSLEGHGSIFELELPFIG